MYLTGMDVIKDDLLVAKPHIFTGVPRLFEKFYDGIYAKGMANTGIKRWLFKQAHDLAIRWEPDGANGGWYEFRLNLARKVVFSKVKAALGLTEIGAIASGSAALQPRLARFFCGAGIPLKEGFGLTETSPVISVNTFRKPGMWRAGSVGMPIRNVEVKIAEDGEILSKGPNVMLGYYKEPEKTAEVLKDGWFHTGDIGEIRDGFLVITDRKKEIFKTSGGKYIAPQMLENLLKESIYIEQVMIVGENQNFPGALIVPDILVLKPWAEKRGLKGSTLVELSALPEVKDLIAADIEKINGRIGKWEQVKSFRLLPQPFTVEGGELTPTLKLKRKNILVKYGELVTEIYSA
jgi:long-chain acyl-CoA synthetase